MAGSKGRDQPRGRGPHQTGRSVLRHLVPRRAGMVAAVRPDREPGDDAPVRRVSVDSHLLMDVELTRLAERIPAV